MIKRNGKNETENEQAKNSIEIDFLFQFIFICAHTMSEKVQLTQTTSAVNSDALINDPCLKFQQIRITVHYNVFAFTSSPKTFSQSPHSVQTCATPVSVDQFVLIVYSLDFCLRPVKFTT